ncbi:spermatogenesis-associated protein 9 isoform X2 [Python bivittatus]|uniref:Spermatogenesis-associated protein 9 isoform X2 n=1 Tax=Python bivittatus TaxID=176946 RepID=A0A9F5MYT0_PYTBI|nr:spermatogenesis-associated protein 9 isoform X2 [Python bivittatus]
MATKVQSSINGWRGQFCGDHMSSTNAAVIQRAFLEIIDEIREEFPNLLRLTRSNQTFVCKTGASLRSRVLQGELCKNHDNHLFLLLLSWKKPFWPWSGQPGSNDLYMLKETDRSVQKSESVTTRVFYSAHGALIMNGLTTLSQSSNSIAKSLQPQLARKLTELNILSHRLLKTLNTPKQPLYRMKAVSINKLLAKIKDIIQTEEASRESSSEDVDESGFPRATEATSPLQQESSVFPIKASHNGGSIHTLLSAMDQESE